MNGSVTVLSQALAVRLAWSLFTLAALSAPVRAEALPRTAVLRPHAEGDRAEATVYSKVVAALRELHVADVLPEPPLDLEAVQLAIDCMEQSARCLREVAHRTNARVVIAPSLTHHSDGLELSILFFDEQSDEAPHKAMRRQSGDSLAQATLDAIPGMLRELFQVEAETPPAEAEPSAANEAQPAPTEEAAPASNRGGLPLGPLLLGGAGVASLAVGLTIGALMHKTQNDYAAHAVTTQAEAAAADAQRKRGNREALLANVLIGAGAAAILAGSLWLASGLAHEDKPAQARIAPVLGPNEAGLSVRGTWEALR
jgi:hypothetical protein